MKIFPAVLLLILTLPHCSCEKKSKPKTTKTFSKNAPLKLITSTGKNSFKLNEPVYINVSLTNTGTYPVKVNNRLLLSYQEWIDRELYCEIYDQHGNRYDTKSDHNTEQSALPVSVANLQFLNPGDSISTRFNLMLWYRIKKEGHYTVKTYYAPEETDLAKDLYRIHVESEPLKLQFNQ